MTANDLVQSRSISRHIYPKLKILVWGAYAYAIYSVSVGGYWAVIGKFMLERDPGLIWIASIAGIISSIVVAGRGIADGEFSSLWNGTTSGLKGKKISIFLGIVLGLFYILLVPFVLLAQILYLFFLFLSMKWIPGD